jgi:hypothetical protein
MDKFLTAFREAFLLFLFLGIVAGSGIVTAACKLPAFKVERWVNSTPLNADGSRQGRARRRLGVHLRELDPYRALRQGVEPRLRPARPGRGRRACSRARRDDRRSPCCSTEKRSAMPAAPMWVPTASRVSIGRESFAWSPTRHEASTC